MADTTIHANFERLRRSMDAMSEIHEATLKSMFDAIRESRDEFRQAYHEFKEGLRQDLREFKEGLRQDLHREIPARGSTIPVVTGTTPGPIRSEKPAVGSKIEASPGIQFNFSGVTRVEKHDFPRMVDDIVELTFDGCIGNTQMFDPGGIDGVNDCGECLQSAFDFSIQTQGYDSHYQGVYPVKCKQDRFIIEDIVEFGSKFQFGLEAGSKPEILLGMSCLCKGNPEAFLVCNGFKDAEYISLALLGRKLELNTMIVFEQEEKLDLVISEVYELVNMLLSQDVCSKKEKSALKEAKSLVNAMLGYMSVCSSNILNEESTEEVGFSVSIGDWASVWTDSNSELGSFFPLVSDDICKKMNEEDFSVNYLAGVVLAEAFFLKLILVIDLSPKMNVRPVIGLRAKLRTKHSSHFGSTSGEKGKFGLITIQIVRVVQKLRQVGMLDCLQLLSSTALLSYSVAEAAQLYCELIRLGAHMKVIDIGSGLGIDYDRSKSGESDLSVAYSPKSVTQPVINGVAELSSRKKKWWIKEFAWFQKLQERSLLGLADPLPRVSGFQSRLKRLGEEEEYGSFPFLNWTAILENRSLSVDVFKLLSEEEEESGHGEVVNDICLKVVLLIFTFTTLQRVSMHIWLPENMFSLINLTAAVEFDGEGPISTVEEHVSDRSVHEELLFLLMQLHGSTKNLWKNCGAGLQLRFMLAIVCDANIKSTNIEDAPWDPGIFFDTAEVAEVFCLELEVKVSQTREI